MTADQTRQIANGVAEFLAELSRGALSAEEVGRVQLLPRVVQHYRAALFDAQRAAGTIAEVAGTIPAERTELQGDIAEAIAHPKSMAKKLEKRLKTERGILK